MMNEKKLITRVEVIDETGRAYVRWDCEPTFSLQDNGRTLKIFVMSMDCCYECGKKKYGVKGKNFGGITVHKGVCPFCKKKRMLIPGMDWAGIGD